MTGAPTREAEATTTYDRVVGRLRTAALEGAARELGGVVTDWRATFEGPSQVVLKAWSAGRFGTFAAALDPATGAVSVECYGTRASAALASRTPSGPSPMSQPSTGAQIEAVARALDEWLEQADRHDDRALAQREQVRAFRAGLAQQSSAAEAARQNAEDLLVLLRDPDADEEQLRHLADQLAGFVHPRARRRFARH